MARNILLKLTADPSEAKHGIQQVEGDLKRFDKLDVSARADIKTEAAKLKIDKLHTRLANLGRQDQTVDVKIRTAGVVRQIERIERDLDHAVEKRRRLNVSGGAGGSGGGVLGRLGGVLPTLGGLAGAGATAGGITAIKTSSDINEATSKNKTIFKASADVVDEFAKKSAESLGISRKEALDATGTFGGLLTALGIAPARAAKMSISLTKLAADLGSFNNKSTQDAVAAIQSLFVGETEPIRAFNVNTNDTQLRQVAKRIGLVKDTKTQLTPQQRTLAANELLFGDQTKSARGDFDRTKDQLANQVKILQAELSDRLGKTGDIAKPLVTDGIHVLTAAMRGDFREGVRPLPHILVEALKFPLRLLKLQPFVVAGRLIGKSLINALIDTLNFGIRQVNHVLRPRDLGPLGHTPDLRLGEITPLGGNRKSGGVEIRKRKPSSGPAGGDPAGRFNSRATVFVDKLVMPPTAAPIGDPAYDAQRLHRGLRELGAATP